MVATTTTKPAIALRVAKARLLARLAGIRLSAVLKGPVLQT
ncbi:protein of unknown function [Shinella sp. WSC3-e]|nr:hypothetical protein SHINE37_43463 [Rhizobiaceae bacterium]CAK7258005.1 protein of unknown function [Shinella sp. WSC3-e]